MFVTEVRNIPAFYNRALIQNTIHPFYGHRLKPLVAILCYIMSLS